MFFKNFFSQQAKNPTGIFGRLVMSKVFDLGNSNLNHDVKQIVMTETYKRILEIGFGTGKFLNEIALNMKFEMIEGIDTSDEMLKIAIKRNKRLIESGKIVLIKGDFTKQTYNPETYDLIIANNVLYFWEYLQPIFSSTYNILKIDGTFIIGVEELSNKINNLNNIIFKDHNKETIGDTLNNIGFRSIDFIPTKENTNYFIIKAIK